MKGIFLIILAVMSVKAYAAEVFLSADDFIQKYTGGKKSLYTYTISEQTGKFIVGAIYPIREEAKQGGAIFILERLANGKYRLDDKSEQGGDLDSSDRTYVEFIEVQGDRFSVQYNSRTVCGVVTYIYRFKKIKNTWRVTGSDNSDTECLDGGDIGDGDKISKNFLTGKIINENYKNGNPAGSRVSFGKFPQFLFKDFYPFDEKYGERF